MHKLAVTSAQASVWGDGVASEDNDAIWTKARGTKWSPDGTSVAFLAPRQGVTQLWKAEADGRNPSPLTKLETGVLRFWWGPSGEQLAVVSPTRERDRSDRN